MRCGDDRGGWEMPGSGGFVSLDSACEGGFDFSVVDQVEGDRGGDCGEE